MGFRWHPAAEIGILAFIDPRKSLAGDTRPLRLMTAVVIGSYALV